MPRFFLPLLTALAVAAMPPAMSSVHAMEEGQFLLGAPLSPPYSISASDPPRGGVSPRVARLVFDRLGLSYVFRQYPIGILANMLRDGSADGVPLAIRTPEREAFLLFSIPLLEGKEQVFVNSTRGRDAALTQLEDLRGLRVGLVEQFAYSPPVMAALASGMFEADMAPDNTVAFRRLALGGVDAVICNEIMSRRVLEQEPSLRAMVRQEPVDLPPVTLHFAVSRRSPLATRLPEINQAILDLRRDNLEETIWREE